MSKRRAAFLGIGKLDLLKGESVRKLCQYLVLAVGLVGFGGNVAQAGPAPALTSVSVYAVASSKSPNWYYPPAGALSVSGQGGPVVLVATLDVGYSTAPVAKFQGVQLTQIQLLPVVSASGYIVGYVRVWQYTGAFKTGTFTYQASSLVAPFRTYSLFMNILN